MRLELNRLTTFPAALRDSRLRNRFAISPKRSLLDGINAVLIESFLIIQVTLFWVMFLPIAGLFRLVIVFLEKIETLRTPRGPVGSSRPGYRLRTRPSHA